MFTRLFGWGRTRARRNDEANAAAMADRLIDMGYLKYLPTAERDVARGELVESLRDGCLDTKRNRHGDARDRRGYAADAEDLAEGRIGETIMRMSPVLRAEGVTIDRALDLPDDDDDGYHLEIDGVVHVIFTRTDQGQNAWMLGTRRLLEIVDDLLVRAGSAERLYGVYGGHDGRVLLLTCEMHAYLRSLGDAICRKWMPVPPTNTDD
jgi:hypothetical protein